MKNCTLLLCLLLAGSLIKAQGLMPSTVRQVFSLQRGDSLEYHIWNVGACSPQCNYYISKVVDSVSYNFAQDTLSIFFQTQIVHFDSSGPPVMGASCGECHTYFMNPDIYHITSDRWTTTYLDSSIIAFLDSSYHLGLSQTTAVSDSIFRDSLAYDNSRQNFYNGAWDFDGSIEVYADSIGIVYKAENVELSSNNREQLIYYHKANGSAWGTPYINTGISDIADAYHIDIFPNPTEERFVIRTNQYQGLRFELYDVLSKRVMDFDLSSKQTEVNRNKLPSGIYYWQIADVSNVIKAGKIVLE
jgi:hypothetical protein